MTVSYFSRRAARQGPGGPRNGSDIIAGDPFGAPVGTGDIREGLGALYSFPGR